MANHGIATPLLNSHPPDPPPQGDLIMTVHSDNHQNPQNNNNDNPYEEVLGCSSSTLVIPPTPTIDPFRNATPRIEGVYEVLKIMWCFPIAVLRGVLFGVCLLVGFCATKLALLGWKDKHSPMPMWRCRMMWITRVCARCILFSFGYHWIRRKGKPAPRDAAPVVVSNHVSYIEPIFYFYEIFPTILASESHDSIPFVGTIIRAMQVIYVDRFSPSSRKQAVDEIKRRVSSDNFPRILLFPEGTTTNGRVLISFQLGAFIHGHPIQPVTVRYPHVHFDQSWGHISLTMLLFRMFMQFHNFMEVEYLPVICPLGNQKETAGQFAARTSRAMATALNVVQTSHSYGDLKLLTKASQSQENPANFMVEMAMMELSSHVNSVEAVEFLDKFLSMDPDPSGRVGYSDFLRGLKLKPCSISEKIFGFIDVEKMGAITFKQFLYGSVYVRKQPLFRKACELAFAKCDAGGNNFILENEFGHSIRYAIPDINKDEIGQLFNLFDTDRDGRLSKDDFLTCLRGHPLLIALFSPCLLSNHMHNGNAQMFKEIV